ncbi:hypothetical protein [Mycolicibacterium fortuitum]|uniref:Uncharacterized protein n=1 Tax=Mycolicibacterium fortuitum TaxID=1766 RepID=A0AAE4VDS8_MYCFO|nr:hypothetical protein [Mycolicibacterium fortuitum]MCV7137670.1 hypothetical protein [Mycolicibacterium fortuitum]MDV7193321.1 hypothetical protein [Mycolicibacterium fortuitum]MDV7205998.1 hypothetical protein [Mycolicibacterium fortuitum]MDV7227411.1 hypothetical protein [Mycolicibacterium fortuitum]MDV7259892.1 hypothetical protein [Mycolicibacterium fortuitum]
MDALTTTDSAANGAPAASTASGNADEVVHIVSWWQWFLDMVLRLKVPRALCGESLAGDPDLPDPAAAGAPMCARCFELDEQRSNR